MTIRVILVVAVVHVVAAGGAVPVKTPRSATSLLDEWSVVRPHRITARMPLQATFERIRHLG